MSYRAFVILPLLLSTGCAFLPKMGNDNGSNRASPEPRAVPDDPKMDHSGEELEAFIDKHTEGYSPLGDEMTGTLEDFEALEVDMKRGKCYRFVLRLANDADWGEHARKGVAFKFTSGGYPEVRGGPGVHGPGAVASGGCPQTDRTSVFDMFANWGSARDKSRLHELGSGGYTIQLYAKDISEEQLAENKRNMERQLEKSRAFNEEYQRKEEARKRKRDAQRSSSRRSSSSSPSSPSGPVNVSVSIKNECRQTVKLFYGKKPKFGSGTYSSLGSNTRTSKSMREGDMIWLVDDKQNGIGAVTVSSGTRNVEIMKSCSGIVAR